MSQFMSRDSGGNTPESFLICDDHVELTLYDKYRDKNIVVLVSLGKWDMVRRLHWFVDKKGYIRSAPVAMHRLITDAPDGMLVDHRDGCRHNNLDDNLRICTTSENTINSGLYCTNTSGHKGITWHGRRGKWQARITRQGTTHHLGYHSDINDAIRARDNAERRLDGGEA